MHSKIPVVFVTSYADIHAAIDTLKAGAADFLFKPVDPEKLIGLVKSLADRSALALEGANAPASLEAAVASLTDRPRRVLGLMVEGLDNAAVAEHLGLSVRTVEVHRAAVYKGARRAQREAVLKTRARTRENPELGALRRHLLTAPKVLKQTGG